MSLYFYLAFMGYSIKEHHKDIVFIQIGNCMIKQVMLQK